MPPECDVCGRRPDPDADGLDGFTTLTFADHVPLPDGMTGHPKGVHWLCAKHAEDLADHTDLPWSVARSRVRRFLAGLTDRDDDDG